MSKKVRSRRDTRPANNDRPQPVREPAAVVARVATPPAIPWTSPDAPDLLAVVEAAPVTRAGPAPLKELVRAHGLTAVVLFALALLVRTAALFALRRTPHFEMLNIDMKSYHEMALVIRNGHWMPTEVFYQSPLYAYFLAVLYKLFGTSLWVARVVNILLGSANVVLLYAIGTRLFSRRVGLLAAITLLLYGPMILEETGILKTALVAFTVLLSLALLLRHEKSGSRGGIFAAGFMLGVTAVGAGQFLVAIPALAFYLGSRWVADSKERRLGLAGIFLAGCILALAPVCAWNTHAGGGLLLTSADAGLNLYMGNNARATGLPAKPSGLRDLPEFEPTDAKSIAEKDTGHDMTMAQVSRYWSGRAVAYMGDHPSEFVDGLVKKFLVLWNGYEIPDDYHYAFMRDQFMPILWAFPTFALVGPLALVGLIAFARRWRALFPLYVVCLSYLGILVLFYIRGRYRMAILPLLIVFAAAGALWLVEAVRRRQWTQGWVGAGLVAFCALLVNHTYTEPPHHGWPALSLDGTVWFDDEYSRLAGWEQDKGTREGKERAIAYYDDALRFSKDPSRIGTANVQRGLMAQAVAKEYLAAGNRLEALKMLHLAEDSYKRCVEVGFRTSTAQSTLETVKKDMEPLINPP